MSFSKTEREFLEHIKNNKQDKFKKDIYVNKEKIDLDTTDTEIWKESRRKSDEQERKLERKRYDYCRQLNSRINRKVKQMEADIALYYEVRKKGNALYELLP